MDDDILPPFDLLAVLARMTSTIRRRMGFKTLMCVNETLAIGAS
ncbi:MAG TPA: hypothetical protein PKE16_11805 [Hyphomicrobium sp.]|nr:hypothetical protein [Hyphomicrobium sp.]